MHEVYSRHVRGVVDNEYVFFFARQNRDRNCIPVIVRKDEGNEIDSRLPAEVIIEENV